MIQEVLDIMRTLAPSGSNIVAMTPAVDFAHEVADHVIVFDQELIGEQNITTAFFKNAQRKRTRLVLSKIMQHQPSHSVKEMLPANLPCKLRCERCTINRLSTGCAFAISGYTVDTTASFPLARRMTVIITFQLTPLERE